ncbi:MAG: hypothetical protein PHR25_07000 [Clostridia bacterium]|nr:hypothetical protein [Clostridia bacterium]
MFLGNRNYFCADIPCDIPLAPLIDGKPAPPLLQQEKVDSVMRTNREKGLREYYNRFQKDAGESQIIKWGQIRRNETLLFPELSYTYGGKYIIAFDPARSMGDNSIVTAMKLIEDENIGWYGEIVNCTNLIDIGNKKGYKMSTPDQIKFLKETILNYNGKAPDYENILGLLIDPGAGGGGITAYGDNLLEDWKDKKGLNHKGFLDQDYDLYEGYQKKYPNASNVLSFLSPHKLRTQMVDEFIELMGLDLIKFPKEYDNKGYISISEEGKNGEVKLKNKTLTMEEEISLINLDILKTEITSIHKFENAEGTSKTYKLSKEKEKKIHDDRFYTIIMLSHFLYDLRRKNVTGKKNNNIDWMSYCLY